MRAVFEFTLDLAGVFIPLGYPLIAVARGARVSTTVAKAWLMQVTYYVVISLVLREGLAIFSGRWAKKIMECLPAETIVVPMTVVGWIPALLAAGAGVIIKSIKNDFVKSPVLTFNPLDEQRRDWRTSLPFVKNQSAASFFRVE